MSSTSFWIKLAKHKATRNYTIVKEQGKDVLIPARHEKTLIFLHGAANTTAMYHSLFLSDFSPVCEHTKIVLPQAPMNLITFSKSLVKMPSWYDILTEDRKNKPAGEVFNLKDVQKSAEYIHKLLDHERQVLKTNGNNSLNKSELFIGGISQGCALALYSGLSYEHKLAGIIALSGYFIDTCKISKQNSDIPIYMSHGTDDDIVKLDYMEQTIQFLKYINPNFSIEYEQGLKHSISEVQMKKVHKWYVNLKDQQDDTD